MAKRSIHEDSFAEGTIISYVAIILTKILGLIYTVPFYSIIGEGAGEFVYTTAYSIYSLLLDISTAGIPTAMSIILAEYITQGKYKTKEKAYKLGTYIVVGLSLVSFLVVEIFAPYIAQFYLSSMSQGATLQDVTIGIRVVALSILIVPFLSLIRGYLQGHKVLGVPATSQVIEQLFRIVVVLVGSYIAIIILGQSDTFGVDVALTGPFFGALVAYIYVYRKRKANSDLFLVDSENEIVDSTSIIAKKILQYCSTIVIISVANSIYNIIDMRLITTGLLNVGYDDATVQSLVSVTGTWVPKICLIVTSLSLGMTSSIAPHMADSYARKDYKDVNQKLNQAISILLVISIPLCTGMIIFAEPIYRLFYGYNDYAWQILILSLILNVFSSITSVVGMSMQSMGKGKTVCFCTIAGIALNATMDLPFIYLFNIFDKAYLGAAFSSIVAKIVNIILLIHFMKDDSFSFNYKPSIEVLKKVVPATVAMAVVVVLVKLVFPVGDGRTITVALQLLAYGLIGCIVYFPITYVTGVLDEAFGKKTIDRILSRLHIFRG